MEDFIKFIFIVFSVLATPFVVAHVIDHWDDPIYPHSGFSPECPTWDK